MHKVMKAFPCSFDGVHSEHLDVGDEREFGTMAEGLKRAGLIADLDGIQPGGSVLRTDGPTIAEYVSRGYPATGYPPQGYAAVSSPEEIEAAIKAEADAKAKQEADEKAEIEAKAKKEAEDKAKQESSGARDAMLSELAKMTVAQLREAAAAENIELADGANKEAIIQTIADARLASKE